MSNEQRVNGEHCPIQCAKVMAIRPLSRSNLIPANDRGSRIGPWSALVARCSLLVANIHRPQADGFTLLEILVAIFILGIVVTTVMASFSMVFSTIAPMEDAGAAFEMGKNCLNRITTDLENITIAERPFYKPPAIDGPPDPYRVQGTNESVGGTQFAKLQLASRAHVPLGGSPREGIAEIIYYVQARPDGSFQLKRADHLYPYPRFEERSSDPVLCENVKSLAFLYYAEDGADSETWDSESEIFANATPSMVAVRLEIAAGEDVFLFQTAVRLPLVRRKQG